MDFDRRGFLPLTSFWDLWRRQELKTVENAGGWTVREGMSL